MQGEYKKDYEPYQTMGPLSGIFDQRAAERLTRRADTYGFDAISIGGVIAWLLECLSEGLLEPAELGAPDRAMFTPQGFDVVADSAHNADIGIAILDSIIQRRGILDLRGGARKFARRLSREKGKAIFDRFVYAAFGRNGWMVPNQYWTPGVLSPMAVMGKYYMYYGNDFLPPRTLGRMNAAMMKNELLLDNSGFCRFHRAWAEEMLPEIVDSLYGTKEGYLQQIATTASRINSRNASVFWESERNIDYVHSFLKRKREIDGERRPELEDWIQRFDSDRNEAALGFWCEIQKGVMESLREL
jgi:glyceraldehyde-3-phosphate dehydrogenase (ferredoxin)